MSALPSPPLPFHPDQHVFRVLVPCIDSEDENLRYYYDFSRSAEEYRRVFAELGSEWEWLPVTMQTHRTVAADTRHEVNGKIPVVINLCDGDEINGVPGISVISALRDAGVPFTGADEAFYSLTTSKITMKRAFEAHAVPTPEWEAVEADGTTVDGIFDRIGQTLIVKPAVSGGSMGLSVKNVVRNAAQLRSCLGALRAGYRGWDLVAGGVIAERFIDGREFTTFIVGSASNPEQLIVYPSVERVFHASLPPQERFLSFDRRWETYDEEAPMPDGGCVYTYAPVDAHLHADLAALGKRAYHAVEGTGYGRIDFRMEAATGRISVLEVNAQCGLSEDENMTSIGAMLRLAGKSFTELTLEIVADALRRNGAPHR